MNAPTPIPSPDFRPLTPEERERSARVSAVKGHAARAAIGARQAHQLWPDAGDTPALPVLTPLAEPEPAADPVDGAKLLDTITAVVERHLALPALSAATLALWALHAWAPQAHTISPRLAIVSPEAHAGKTTALRVLAQLTPRPLLTVHARAAPLLRTIDFTRPTLLLDDAERWLLANRVLRAAIAGGHARDARMLKESLTPFELPAHSCFSPCTIAATGRLPPDLAKRSIEIQLMPMLPNERRIRIDKPASQIEDIRAQCVRWSRDHFNALANAEPELPRTMSYASRDLWRPLLAIAGIARGDWLERAYKAALALSANADARSLNAELLHDIREALGENDRIATKDLLAQLTRDPERPWHRMARGRPLDAYELGRRLAAFYIHSRQIRFADGAARGYFARDFEDSFARYLGPRVYTPYEGM